VICPDVNVLVYACNEAADRHEDYRAWLDTALAGPAPVAVSDLVLSGFLRVVTHPAVLKVPLTPERAWDFVTALRESENVVPITPGRRHWSIFSDLFQKVRPRGNAVPDTYLAALAIEHGCEWISADRGFARFAALTWRHPLD